ncbi:hypothetical protein [Streptomyces sp. NPDC055749]
MSTVPTLTPDSSERLVVGLRGRTVVAGDYLVLVSGDDDTELDEWGHGLWHEPTMGIELTTGDGGSYSAVWGSTFDHYGVELHPAPMSDFRSLVGTPGGAARVAFAEQRLWAGIVSSPIESCRIQWAARNTAPRLRCPRPSICGPPSARCGSPLAARPRTRPAGRSSCAPTMYSLYRP